MSRRPTSLALLLVVLAAVAAAIWAVSTGSRPALAVYDSMSGPAAPADTLAAGHLAPGAAARDTSVHDSSTDDTAAPSRRAPAADSLTQRVRAAPPLPRTRAAATADSAAHPHRSDNYGGYSGYGSKERRGDPNAR